MEELKNVINFDIPKEKKIQKKKDSDNRKYIVLPISILKHKLTGSELKILLLLGSYANKAGITWVSQKRLAKEINTTRQYINNNIGIAHTRWGTHGYISDINSHPHTDNDRNIYLVHNGIINNYETIKISDIKAKATSASVKDMK